MPTGIMGDVNVRLIKRKYRKCESVFDLSSWNDLKLNEETVSLIFFTFLA